MKELDTNGTIGHLKWTITGEDGTVISQGERDVVQAEAKIDKIEGSRRGSLTKMTVPLSDHFLLGLTSSDSDLRGFGITAGHELQRLFSWEWFTVYGNKATKLQESGELRLEMTGDKIEKITFDTDVSLRLIEMSGDANSLKPKYRILIARGSNLTRPR